MSRVPQASSSRPTVKTTLVPPNTRSRAPSPSKPSAASSSPLTPRARTKSIPKSPSKSTRRPPPEGVPRTPLNIKAAIALKRAEAKKAVARPNVSGGRGFDNFDTLEDAIPGVSPTKEEDENLDLGRWSVKETIERARSTGSINLVSRSLPCLPSALFEIHLGVNPDALKSVPQEPSISSSEAPGRRSGQREGLAWFEAQDLQVLKAWNNEIIEIQHEISLFGSLKTVDLHQNKISALPDTFADLTALTSLDLSHNSLSSLPVNIFALPTLTNLNLSHNALVALPFGAPFSAFPRASRTQTNSSGGFFGPVITRATSPLPRLLSLDVSFNKLTASAIDHENLPPCLSKVDLSSNPIAAGNSEASVLIRSFGVLRQLKELRLSNADIGDDAFPPTLFSGEDQQRFPSLRVLDLEETRASAETVKAALAGLKQSLSFVMTTDEPSEGTVRITIGKTVLKEAWEIEAERRPRSKNGNGRSLANAVVTGTVNRPLQEEPLREYWEIEAEQGLLTEGGRRRARAAAAAESITATAGAASSDPKRNSLLGVGRPSTPSGSQVSTINLGIPQYYHAPTQTLTLPPLSPATRSHVRSFSLAASASSTSATAGKTDIALPTPSLPIAAISTQSFACTLKILVLSNRKLDLSVSLPSFPSDMDAGLIPTLEELVLDGCGFGDNVSVTRQVEGGFATPPKSSEALLPLLTKLFPSLRTLDLSYNSLTSAALQKDVLVSLTMASPQDAPVTRKGLRHLRLRGNRITELEGFQEVAGIFKGHRAVPDWKLEELDLRDNEISKLPADLGLLPLDVFLVDGNVFRIPQRKVWEREGTKGLLSWLRGRLE
ncbi:hypothetical protein BS17DRAFT_109708 [Gyrodon lividus]|nr:hypothetical protein BS17DRAFT_109708 [Gyrodon lividus]